MQENNSSLGHAFGILMLLAALFGVVDMIDQAQERTGQYYFVLPGDTIHQQQTGVYRP